MKTQKLTVAILFLFGLISCGNGSKKVTVYGSEHQTIPGLTASDVHGNFTNKGFSLDKKLESIASIWTCNSSDTNGNMVVTATGDGPSNIISVEGTYYNYSELETSLISKEFIGYVASTPYEGSSPAAAKAWAYNNIEKGGDTIIGLVTFKIYYTSSTTCNLKISVEQKPS